IVKQAMEKASCDVERYTPGAIHSVISNAKNALQAPSVVAAEAGANRFRKAAADVYAQYELLLSENNALDFDDLLMRMAFVLRDNPQVRQTLSDRYRYVLIDEYQDTNHAQYLLADAIAKPHGNICVTGDPDQSIYAWRGADINNILEFERDYPQALVVRLEENYRSTAPILAAASRLIAHNHQRKKKELFTRRSGGADVHILSTDNEHAEADEIVTRVRRAISEGRSGGDIAIFYRVNSLSRLLEAALMKAAVPYRVARGVEFYNRKEIKDVLAYLRLLVNPADDLSCLRIINTPARRIGTATIDRLAEMAADKNLSLIDACRLADQAGLQQATAARVRAFAALIDELAAELDRPVADVVGDVITRSGLDAMLQEGQEETAQARSNVGELISAAAEFDSASEGGSVADYLHQVALVSDVDRLDESGGAVTLMTLHAAKGLEFPVVFIAGCEEGLLPFQRMEKSPGSFESAVNVVDLEEERRLAFVGMTRAKEELILSHATQRMVRGMTDRQVPSPFLVEISGPNVTHEDLTTPPDLQPRRPSRGGFYDDVENRRRIEADSDDNPHYEDEADDLGHGEGFPPEYEFLQGGSMIEHPKFGRGRVVQVRQPWPETRAVIDFQTFGRKTIVLRVVKLKVL
ncbi:MAG: UvrD-helicase domain-containing protein, partial [Planctomycetaceae bacterium]|nr:UvrD-helicase domain-containing protein [Planctomycetaceae bacterium]